jgi:WS/DGAT/MGAT family acyltransferase
MPPALEPHTTESDAFTFRMERDPLLRSTIVSIVLLDRAPKWSVLLDRIERATVLAPSFRQRPVAAPFGLAPPRWETDPDFDLAWHVRRVGAPTPGTIDGVLEMARIAGMTAFDPARPMWEFTLVEGLEGGGAAFLMKVHHSLTDGVGGIELAGHVVDLHRTPRHLGPPPEVPAARAHNPVEELADAVGFDLRRFAGIAAGGVAKLPGAVTRAVGDPMGTATGFATTAAALARFVRPITRTLSPVMTERRLQWKYQVFDVPVADLRRAAKSVDGTLNDAFLAAVAGGMRRYHHGHGAHVPELRVTMPISVRNEGDALGGNRITLVRFAVPVGTADPAARMRSLRTTVGEVRKDKALPFTTAVAGVLNLLPPSATASMLKHVDFLASNVPGFDKPVYLAGARVEGFYALGPTTGTAANITLMSYRGTAHIGVNTDLGAVPDPEEFLRCLQEGFAEVVEVGAELPQRSAGRAATLVS